MDECLICTKSVTDYDPKMCCSGHECGCMGMPTEERRIKAGIELYKGPNEILYINNEPFYVKSSVIEAIRKNKFIEFNAFKELDNDEWTRFYYSPFIADNPNKITLEKYNG